ncbi:MAG TPA: Fe-S cluster assembly protein SufD [Streptosporangiaceae bacterium]|nr:Fe-S cluster assembly protein SufD [Streptosporangiaceae bacterium]
MQSFDVADFPVPTGREEEWRFTPLRRLRDLQGDSPLPPAKVSVETDPAPGVLVESGGRSEARIGRSFVPADRVSARAFASFGEATVITVPAEHVASRPTVVTVRGQDTEGAAFGHTLVDVQPLAQAVVVLDHAGSATYADNVELVVGDGASLTVVSLQDWADDAVHASHHHARLGRDASIRHIAVTLGGGLVRLAPSVRYDGPGGDAELLGMYYADAGQHLEHRLFVDHSAPNCRSRVDYKGALQGDEAHTVWIGDVVIRPEATGTDSYERNRNLVLTDGTRVDSVPNLEILTGEVVGAGHASTSGRLEDQHLFYLMARGIPESVARRLVIRGFFGTLIDRIGIPQVEARISAGIELELA